MNKAFVKEDAEEEEDGPSTPPLPPGTKNYMTRRGYALLKTELDHLLKTERPALVQVVSWAAKNGDRSENGDYIYGKKRLREIDRRLRFLINRLDSSVVVDPASQENVEQVFFGATVTVCDSEVATSPEETYQIVGVDEADISQGLLSWTSPLARALLKAREGETVRFQSPAGIREMEVVKIHYEGK